MGENVIKGLPRQVADPKGVEVATVGSAREAKLHKTELFDGPQPLIDSGVQDGDLAVFQGQRAVDGITNFHFAFSLPS